jgi:hypothetical protein
VISDIGIVIGLVESDCGQSHCRSHLPDVDRRSEAGIDTQFVETRPDAFVNHARAWYSELRGSVVFTETE